MRNDNSACVTVFGVEYLENRSRFKRIPILNGIITWPWKVKVMTLICLGPHISTTPEDTDLVSMEFLFRKWLLGIKMVMCSMTSRDHVFLFRTDYVLTRHVQKRQNCLEKKQKNSKYNAKLQFNTLLTAILRTHIEDSKNHKGYITKQHVDILSKCSK